MTHMRVGIIGGGIFGTSIGYYLSLYKGVDVTIFEKNTIGSGTTAKSAGTVCLMDDSVTEEFFPERLFGFQTFVEMEKEEPGSTGFDKCGTLVVAPTEEFANFVKRHVQLAWEAGFHADYLENSDDIRKIVPDLNLEEILGAGYTPDDGYFDATALAVTYARKARSQGTKVLIGTAVTGITTSGGRVSGVDTNKGHFDCDVVILAAGPWSRFVGRLARLELPLWHTKAEVFILEPKEPLGYALPILKYPRFYTRPEKGNVFICKSHVTVDLSNKQDAGLFDPDTLPMTGGTEPYFFDFLMEQLSQYYPRLLESAVANSWVGYRDVTMDGMPILGDSPVPGLILAVGPGGNGVIEAPAVATALAKYVVTGEKSALIERLNLERFDQIQVK
ncbi:MAG: FAD-binding oxidoreductase [Chloroflexi bacterium]|nr:FAD-binding oxidoreductase [Chloroflexota bacterium]